MALLGGLTVVDLGSMELVEARWIRPGDVLFGTSSDGRLRQDDVWCYEGDTVLRADHVGRDVNLVTLRHSFAGGNKYDLYIRRRVREYANAERAETMRAYLRSLIPRAGELLCVCGEEATHTCAGASATCSKHKSSCCTPIQR